MAWLQRPHRGIALFNCRAVTVDTFRRIHDGVHFICTTPYQQQKVTQGQLAPGLPPIGHGMAVAEGAGKPR